MTLSEFTVQYFDGKEQYNLREREYSIDNILFISFLDNLCMDLDLSFIQYVKIMNSFVKCKIEQETGYYDDVTNYRVVKIDVVNLYKFLYGKKVT